MKITKKNIVMMFIKKAIKKDELFNWDEASFIANELLGFKKINGEYYINIKKFNNYINFTDIAKEYNINDIINFINSSDNYKTTFVEKDGVFISIKTK